MKINRKVVLVSIGLAFCILSITQFGLILAQNSFATASSNHEDNSGSDNDCKQEGPGYVDHDASCKNGHESENGRENKGENEN